MQVHVRLLARASVLVAVGLSAAACAPFAQDPAPVTPQRPTVSSDTSTTKVGTLELEAGATVDPGDSLSVPTTLKWGAGEHTELFVGWPAFVHIERPGDDADGPGSVSLGVRHRFLEELVDRPSVATQLTTKLPTASQREGLDSGEIDFHAALIASQSFSGVALTGFYRLGVLGNPGPDGTILEHDIALAAGTSLDDRWGIFGEAAALLTPETDTEDVRLTLGATYAFAPSLVLDVGIAVGLTREAPDFQAMVGFTHNFGDIFAMTGIVPPR